MQWAISLIFVVLIGDFQAQCYRAMPGALGAAIFVPK
jgi:hypothetical protein